mgnify:CR=1 FL=1
MMKQKIEVQVAAAVDERWPKVCSASCELPSGTRYVVQESSVSPNKITLYKMGNGKMWQIETMQKPKLDAISKHIRICFDDFSTASEWWINPQPVKSEPETIKVKDLKSGSFFQVGKDVFLHATCQHCPTLTNIGTTVVFDDNREVIPFYGTITINIGRE